MRGVAERTIAAIGEKADLPLQKPPRSASFLIAPPSSLRAVVFQGPFSISLNEPQLDRPAGRRRSIAATEAPTSQEEASGLIESHDGGRRRGTDHPPAAPSDVGRGFRVLNPPPLRSLAALGQPAGARMARRAGSPSTASSRSPGEAMPEASRPGTRRGFPVIVLSRELSADGRSPHPESTRRHQHQLRPCDARHERLQRRQRRRRSVDGIGVSGTRASVGTAPSTDSRSGCCEQQHSAPPRDRRDRSGYVQRLRGRGASHLVDGAGPWHDELESA